MRPGFGLDRSGWKEVRSVRLMRLSWIRPPNSAGSFQYSYRNGLGGSTWVSICGRVLTALPRSRGGRHDDMTIFHLIVGFIGLKSISARLLRAFFFFSLIVQKYGLFHAVVRFVLTASVEGTLRCLARAVASSDSAVLLQGPTRCDTAAAVFLFFFVINSRRSIFSFFCFCF